MKRYHEKIKFEIADFQAEIIAEHFALTLDKLDVEEDVCHLLDNLIEEVGLKDGYFDCEE